MRRAGVGILAEYESNPAMFDNLAWLKSTSSPGFFRFNLNGMSIEIGISENDGQVVFILQVIEDGVMTERITSDEAFPEIQNSCEVMGQLYRSAQSRTRV